VKGMSLSNGALNHEATMVLPMSKGAHNHQATKRSTDTKQSAVAATAFSSVSGQQLAQAVPCVCAVCCSWAVCAAAGCKSNA